MKNRLKKKIASYGALSSAFIIAGNHEVEAQIVYVDLPDNPIEASVSALRTDVVFDIIQTETRYINLDMEAGIVNIGNSVSSNADFAFNLYAKIEFSAYYTGSYTLSTASNTASAWNSLVAGTSNVIGTIFPSNLPLGGIYTTPFSVVSNNMGAVAYTSGGDTYNGSFVTNANDSDVTGFLGVRFDIGGNNHFGWVRVRVEQQSDNNNGVDDDLSALSRMTILDYAYQSQPDTPIAIGDVGVQAPIPTLSQWGIIMLNLLIFIFGFVAVRERNQLVFHRRHE